MSHLLSRVRAESLDAHPPFPFCSPRCRLVDLGRWIDGAYAIPAGEAPADGESSVPDDDEDES
jgi:endogenous inhibitor of DNA gyrase (YacG/DUF329 family)